jgi:amino acid transporter
MFGFFGFECATALFPIVEHPTKNVPRALTYAIGLVGLLYTLFITTLILSTPLDYFSSPDLLVSDLLAHTFPDRIWLVRSIHFAILSAIVGTIHAMIWSSSLLLRDFAHVVSLPTITQRTAVFIVGACITLSYTTISNLALFFNLTAFFVVFAYLMAMIALLANKQERHSGHNYKALVGIATACIIFVFALEGLLHELSKLM